MDKEWTACEEISFRISSEAIEWREPIDAEFLKRHMFWQPKEYKTSKDKKCVFKNVDCLRVHSIGDVDCGGVDVCPICFEYVRDVCVELIEKAHLRI